MTTIALPTRRGGATRSPRGIRTWGIFVVLASLLAVMELAAACGTSQAPPQTGIEVVITTDNLSAPTDFNDISLQVSEKLADGGWNQLVNKDYPEPSTQNPFPATFAIGSGQSPDEQALVSVTAYQGGAAAQGGVPVVQRVAEVPLPNDRIALLVMLLSGDCKGDVVQSPKGPIPTCQGSGADQYAASCQPGNGMCGSSVIPTPATNYTPGQSLDGGTELGGMYFGDGGPPPVGSGNADAASDAGPDVTVLMEASEQESCNTCTQGTSACIDGGVASCVFDGGCWTYGPSLPCGNPLQSCSTEAGTASCACEYQCSAGQSLCVDGGLESCVQQGDGGPCWQWGTVTACPEAFQTCMGPPGAGSCTCDNQCAPGQFECVGGSIAPCAQQGDGGDSDGGDCWEWGNAAPCTDPLMTCTGTSGAASCTCSNECTSGQTLCGAGDTGEIQTCTQQSDGCWEWGAAASCADSNMTCPSGSTTCTCINAAPCTATVTAGENMCSSSNGGVSPWQGGTTYVTCNLDSYGCYFASAPATCATSTPFCYLGACTAEPPSCQTGGTGMSNCDPSSTADCCSTLEISGSDANPGTTFYRTYTNNGTGPTSGSEADPAYVSSLNVDNYLVTVGRFRQFVNAWKSGYYPPAGSGIHTHLNGGLGLANSADPGSYEPGWSAAWNDQTPTSGQPDVQPTDANLECPGTAYTWTPTAGTQENLPINCITWFEAYAFCIWDGGFLPSEAEWEYTAAGGSDQLEYPWGSTPPGSESAYAIYGCYYPSQTSSPSCPMTSYIAPVGYASTGAGRWGQYDLVGDIYEWTLDAYDATFADPCVDCAYLSPSADEQVQRGGDFDDGVSYMRVTYKRQPNTPGFRGTTIGFRCARPPAP